MAGNWKMPFWSYGKLKNNLRNARKGIFLLWKAGNRPPIPGPLYLMDTTYLHELLFLLAAVFILNGKLVAGLPIPTGQDIGSVCTKHRDNVDNLVVFTWDLNKSVRAGLTHEVCV